MFCQFHAALLLAFLAVGALSKGTLMEVTFDLNPVEELPDGYKSSDAVSDFLASENLLWMRYHHVLVADRDRDIGMRVAHFSFTDLAAWSKFQDETLVAGHVLYDHFWENARRSLWEKSGEVAFPDRGDSRTDDAPGGFKWVLKYSVEPAKQNEFRQFFDQSMRVVQQELEKNEDFIEGHLYHAELFRSDDEHMLEFEFRSVETLTKTVYGSGGPMRAFLQGLSGHAESYRTLILAPPVTEEGVESVFWQAQGNLDDEAEAQ
eukprot:NODE_3384_length_987_cov_55.713220_g3111_i0.p1 GENE.NODE_3384_length_987_cov_55.713220_g3111_i0~~NODE_3384_length_987_cov_55.713220_g3111_i0.p1  ORF type:complete len:262 (-),score=60.77 NODE_3384_length_987_cov_55.713220_g3111_i0:146-931(-)